MSQPESIDVLLEILDKLDELTKIMEELKDAMISSNQDIMASILSGQVMDLKDMS